MAKTNDFIANLEQTASAIGKDVQAHPWDAVLAMTHLPFDGGSSVEIAARAAYHAESTTAAKLTNKPADHLAATTHERTSSLPHLEILHSGSEANATANFGLTALNGISRALSDSAASVVQRTRTTWNQVSENPAVAAAFGPVGTAIYDGHQINDYVQTHGGASNILPGLSRIGHALGKGAVDESTQRPMEVAAAGATGALTSALLKVPYLNAAVVGLGLAYAGYEIYKHGGEWMHDADVTYYQHGHNAAEVGSAQVGLQHDGAGLALMGAGGIGAGVGAAAIDGIIARTAATQVTAATEATSLEAATAAGAVDGIALPGQSVAQRLSAQVSQAANDNHAAIQLQAVNDNQTMIHQAEAVNGSHPGSRWTTGAAQSSDTSTNWAEAKVGNANQDRYITPEDRAMANQSARAATKADAWSQSQNFKDLGLRDLSHEQGAGNYGDRLEETLAKNRIHSTAELQGRSEQDLLKLPGINARAVNFIKEALAKKGLELKPDPPQSEIAGSQNREQAPAHANNSIEPPAQRSQFDSVAFSDQPTTNSRIVNALHKKGIDSFDTLAQRYNDGSLQNIIGIGGKALENIRQSLIQKGYQLR